MPSVVACLVLALALLSGAVLGCTKPEATSPSVAQSTAPVTPIEAMTPDAKRNRIADSFPLEVPVPVGEFTRAQSQGDDSWDYVVRVSSTPGAVLDWYRQAYTSRQWIVLSEREHEGDAPGIGGRVLTLRKGNAESKVVVDSQVDFEGMTTARVILGIGAPVLESQ